MDRRLAALERFEAVPWPDGTSEEWRHTDLRGFALEGLTPVPPAQPAAADLDGVPPEILAALGAVGEREGLSVQVDADVVHCRLAPDAAKRGVVFAPLGRAAAELPDLVGDVLGSAGVSESEEKVAALATAFASGGTFVHVPRGVSVQRPLQSMRWISGPGIAVSPRTVIVAEEGASVTLIDLARCAPLAGPGLCAGTVEIHAHTGAHVAYLSLQDWSPEVWHFNIQRAVVGRDATVRSLAATLGGRLSRSVVESVLSGPGGSSEMLAVYFADGEQHFDHRSLQEHLAPHTRSELYVKGALLGASTAVYSGLIRIAKDAQHADAWQGNRNLVLSERAKADASPFLEIEANEVRCAHSASVGPPDEEVMFYLRSRGLGPDEAERLVVKGFFSELLDRIHVAEVREALERAVEDELDAKE